MSTMIYRNGIGTTSAYQVSGIPFATGSTLGGSGEDTVSFPSVTKAVTVSNIGAGDLRVHFNPSSAGNVIGGNHFMTIASSGSFTFWIRTLIDTFLLRLSLLSNVLTDDTLAAVGAAATPAPCRIAPQRACSPDAFSRRESSRK